MTAADIDNLISELAKALLTNQDFEELAKQKANIIGIDSLKYLRYRLQEPPTVHPDIDENDLRLGQWLFVCLYAVFEIIYNMQPPPVAFIQSVAFGEYNWDQAIALATLLRLSVDKKIPSDIIPEINSKLTDMRFETHLYLAENLLRRKKRDSRFDDVLKQITNVHFRCAMIEADETARLTKQELIDLANRIMNCDGSKEEIEKMIELFDMCIPYPNGSCLFYFPENYTGLDGDLSWYNPTAEEVVEKCLSYKPIA